MQYRGRFRNPKPLPHPKQESRVLTLDQKKLPSRLGEDRLDELARKIKEGTATKEDKEELTSGFIKLARHIACNMGGSNYTRVEDYFSCGLFGIAYAIHHGAERLKDQNIAAWIIFQIKEHIRRFRRADHSVPVPASTYLKAKKEGRTLPVAPAVHVLGSREPCSHMSNIYELREIINLCAKEQNDLEIIKLRSYNYTDVEIAERIGISKSQVNNQRRAIEARFDQLMREE